MFDCESGMQIIAPVEEMESNDKEAVDDGFESFDSEDFEDAGQVFSNFSCRFLNPNIFFQIEL